MNLKDLKIGESAIVTEVGGEGSLRQHFLDMGGDTSFYGFQGVLYHKCPAIAREKALFPGLLLVFGMMPVSQAMGISSAISAGRGTKISL